MRKTYHLCISSHDEVMFRCREDYIRGFNCFAEAVLETESRALADAEMSTHTHYSVQTDNHKELMFSSRNKYSRYFNAKYQRSGRLGEKEYFWLELNGLKHTMACLSYNMRQGLHHGLAETPFGYEFCSVNVIFQKQLGKNPHHDLLPERNKSKYLSRDSAARGYRMDKSGLLLREDIIDTSYVEELYISPRSFLLHMNRFSDEKWIKEQEEDANQAPPITLETVEPDSGNNIKWLLDNERGRVDYGYYTDIELCEMIDNEYVPRLCQEKDAPSIYLLSERQRRDIGNRIWTDITSSMVNRKRGIAIKNVRKEQLARCLVL